MELSIVIPAYNEAAALPALLADLRAQQGVALELIVADGGSTDGTPALAAQGGARAVAAPRGRGAQMNAGARAASAPHLLFLHADSRLESPTQLREALDALATAGPQAAGHWPLHFARTQAGHERFYRHLEAKSALNRPGTVNGDQGLLIGAEFLRALGGFDQRLPFLEDQRIAEKIFATGTFVLLPGRLATSARRFEAEGEWRRYTLMAMIMGLHAAGADEYFAGAPGVYATQDATGRLALGPHLAHARRVLRAAGWRRAFGIVWRAGRYARQNAWQMFFALDRALGRESRPLLRFHDRFLRPVTDNFVFDAVGALAIAFWFLLALPLACAVTDEIPRRFAPRDDTRGDPGD
jgi:rSAM/selenodomain-associated transferase 2